LVDKLFGIVDGSTNIYMVNLQVLPSFVSIKAYYLMGSKTMILRFVCLTETINYFTLGRADSGNNKMTCVLTGINETPHLECD
jgi:hypothetical protein